MPTVEGKDEGDAESVKQGAHHLSPYKGRATENVDLCDVELIVAAPDSGRHVGNPPESALPARAGHDRPAAFPEAARELMADRRSSGGAGEVVADEQE
jgi:hypothetical protein